MRRKRDGRRYRNNNRFGRRVHPISGIISFLLGIYSLLSLIISSIYAGFHGGNAGSGVGVAGMLAFVASIVGFFLAWAATKNRDAHFLFPIMGCIMNGVMVVAYIVLMILGVVL
ncbi:MAG: DUF6142 family protein [Lachnospiraceae bacterium]|nr:DUF6142 family protein [Lachnospiraceae bacterium]